MSARMSEAFLRGFDELRHEPVQKRVRALVGDALAVESTRAVLVYEPRRVVPSYAVPADDILGELISAPAAAEDTDGEGFRLGGVLEGRLILDPSIPFSVHTADGEPLSLRVNGDLRESVGFRPADPDLADYVILDFDGFDAWYDEDERIYSHPRDPFHAMEILPSSREVRVELDGQVLAQSRRARLLFEGTLLPVRAYLPREDVRVELRASTKQTQCAYKGQARYWSIDGHEDIAWTYESPLRGAEDIADRIAFFNERVDLFLDGERLERPLTPWS
jgi:uncharacterized protein (DUF427 family)